MGLFEQFPYTNFHELNDNWIVAKMKSLLNKVDEIDSNISEAESIAKQSAVSATKSANSATEAANSAAAAKASADSASQLLATARRFILVGDSYLEGYRVNPGESWGFVFKNTLKLADNNCYMFYKGGVGFGHAAASTGDTFTTLLETGADSVESPETITDVIVLGGYNDADSVALIAGGIASFCRVANEKFPNAKVYIGFVGRGTLATSSKQSQLASVYFEYVSTKLANYLEGIEYACRDISFFDEDGVHPNKTGQENIGIALANIINGVGGKYPYTHYVRTGVVVPATTTCLGAYTALYTSGGQFTFTGLTGTSGGGSNDIDLGEVTGGNMCTFAVQNYTFSFPGFARVEKSTGSGNDFIPVTCCFKITDDRHLHVSVRGLYNGVFAKYNSDNVTIYPNSATYPTMLC